MGLYYFLVFITCFMWTFAVEQFATITHESDISERLLKTLAGVFLGLIGLMFFVFAGKVYTAEHTQFLPSYYYY